MTWGSSCVRLPRPSRLPSSENFVRRPRRGSLPLRQQNPSLPSRPRSARLRPRAQLPRPPRRRSNLRRRSPRLLPPHLPPSDPPRRPRRHPRLRRPSLLRHRRLLRRPPQVPRQPSRGRVRGLAPAVPAGCPAALDALVRLDQATILSLPVRVWVCNAPARRVPDARSVRSMTEAPASAMIGRRVPVVAPRGCLVPTRE